MAINVPKVKPGDLITASYWNLVVDSLVSLQNQIDAIGSTGPPGTAPVITSVDPSPDVPVNKTMTIHGSNFAVPASLNTVTVDGTVLNDFQAGSTDQLLIVGVPGNLTGVPGTKALIVATAAGGASKPFNVHFVAPTIVLSGQVALTNSSGDVGTIVAGTPVLFQFHLDGTALNVPEQFRIQATYDNATGGVASTVWDGATSYIGTSGSDHQVTVSPLSPVNVGISVVPPAGSGASPPEVDLTVQAVSVHNDPASSSLPQKVHIAVGSAPPAADPSMTITLGTNLRSTVHPNAAGTGLDIKYGTTAPITIDAVMGHQGSYLFEGAVDNPDTAVWQILDLPETIKYADGQGQPIQFRLKLVPTTPPGSPVTRTFTLTATRQDDDSIGSISNFLSFPIDGFTG
jgi:hypothetical protein